MTRTCLLAGLGLVTSALALAGCSTPPTGSAAADAPVALAALGPAESQSRATANGGFRFGAGDALGRQVFTHYVASIRASEQEMFATGRER